MEDLYKILNISPVASSQEIKEAYYTLAKKFHPDKNKSSRFLYEEKFKKISMAYSTLSNADRKKEYDQKRKIHLKFKSYKTPSSPQKTPPSQNLNTSLDLFISLEESHVGCIKNIQFKRKVNEIEKTVKLSINIPKGIKEGQKLLLKKQSHQLKSKKGDIFIKIKIKKHPLFQRRGDDLYMTLPLSITEAFFGKKMSIPNLTGEALIPIKPHVHSGQRLSLKGQGFYLEDGSQRGDMILEIKIDIPRQIAEEDKKWFENFKKRETTPLAVTEFNLKAQRLLLRRAS